MKLWIGRHSFAGPTADNPEEERSRPLTSEGRAIAKAIGGALAKRDDKPLVIFCSPYQRAVQTADIYGEILGIRVNEIGDLSPDRPLTPALKNLLSVGGKEELKRVMLIGHHDNTTPAMTDLRDGDKWKPLVMGEVRQVEIDRDTLKWQEVWTVKPSDLGLKDHKDAPSKNGVTGRNATDTVLEQLAHDFPAHALRWVCDVDWAGPVIVPLSEIDFSQADKWRAAREPEKVERFMAHISKGRMKPCVGARGPGESLIGALDGHHRLLAYRKLGRDPLMYVGRAKDARTMADARAMHSHQLENPSLMSDDVSSRFDMDLGTADVQVPTNVAAPKKKRRMTRVSAKLGKGGSLRVTHMSEWAPCLLMAAPPADGPVWIQLAKPGTFNGHRQGAFSMTASTFSEIVRNFKATKNQRIPIDYEHASEQDPTSGNIPFGGAPAQGWIVDMALRDDDTLWGLVEWGTQAREQIRAKQYMFFSPAIRFDAKDRVTNSRIGAVMTSGALTNKPFLDGMAPLAARDGELAAVFDDDGEIVEIEMLPALDNVIGLIDRRIDERIELLANEPEDIPMAMSDAEKAHLDTVTRERDELKTKNNELAVECSTQKATIAKLEGDIKTLKDADSARSMREMNERIDATKTLYADDLKPLGDDAEQTKLLSDLYTNSRPYFDKKFPLKAAEPPKGDLPRPQVLLSTEPVVRQERKDDPATVLVDVTKESWGQTVTRLMNEGDPVEKKPMHYEAACRKARTIRLAAGLPVA